MSRRGFSLVELVLSQAVLMVVVVAFSSIWVLSQQGVASAQLNSDLALKMEEVRNAMKTDAACSLNLQNVNLSLAVPSGASVPRIAHVVNGTLEKEILALNQSVDGHRVTDMRLRPLAQVDAAQVSSVLEIIFERSGLLGSASVTRSVSILAQVSQGRVRKCRVLQDPALSAGKRLCLAYTDGALNDYDPTTDQCTLMNGEWIGGKDAYGASCPAGYSLPEKALSDYNCMAIEPPGFVDPSPNVPVTLADGTTVEVEAPPPYRAQLKNKSCECSYDVDIPVAVRQLFKCQILCLEQ